MVLDTLLSIATLGSKKELTLEMDSYRTYSRTALVQLRNIIPTLEEGTEAKKHVLALVKLLEAELPAEFQIANHLVYIASIFQEIGTSSSEQKENVGKYLKASQEFYRRSQNAVLHENERLHLKKSLSQEEQTALDKRLFENEGMMYCLEFYLSLYKAIQEAPDEAEQRKYIESTDVNLGFGSVPGLWHDFSLDESLNKFIYKILDDQARNVLLLSYYSLKDELSKIHISCDKQDHCNVSYQDTSVEGVLNKFKQFLQTLLDVYQEKGITRLSSIFFQPYGNKASISAIHL